jgi:hypothetical protein
MGGTAKIVLFLRLNAAALMAVCLAAAAGDHGAIEAGIAAGVAGAVASEALSGALQAPGNYDRAYQQPTPRCRTELRQEREGYSYHFGEVQVCR